MAQDSFFHMDDVHTFITSKVPRHMTIEVCKFFFKVFSTFLAFRFPSPLQAIMLPYISNLVSRLLATLL